MNAAEGTIRRFLPRHIINHVIMMVCFVGLVVTGMPQRFPSHGWAKGVVLILGGVERVRFLHHILGTIMALHLVYHFLEAVWLHLVRRLDMPMMPRWQDVKDFVVQVKYNLGLESHPPRMDRYTFAEKLEYLALVWGTALMVITGVVLLFPVRWSSLVSGEVILAAKAAHGGEAILALLSILTWHVYFVHVRHWNRSIFTGHLEEEEYATEHPLELARLRKGIVKQSVPAGGWRLALFAAATTLTVLGVAALWRWLVAVPTYIETVPLR